MMSAIIDKRWEAVFYAYPGYDKAQRPYCIIDSQALGTEYIVADRGSDSRVEILRNPRRTAW
jgi:hypothetical protein